MKLIGLRIWLWYALLTFIVAVLIDAEAEWLAATPAELALVLWAIWRFEHRHGKS